MIVFAIVIEIKNEEDGDDAVVMKLFLYFV